MFDALSRTPKQTGLLGIYWGPRRESLGRCASRAFDSLTALQSVGYERFYRLARSRSAALRQEIAITPQNIEAILAKSTSKTALPPRKPIPNVGWSLGAWSGGDDDGSYGISIHCGAYSKYLGNSFVMNLPAAGPHSLSRSRDRAVLAFERLVEIWRPDQGVLCEGSIEWADDGTLIPEQEPLAILLPEGNRKRPSP